MRTRWLALLVLLLPVYALADGSFVWFGKSTYTAPAVPLWSSYFTGSDNAAWDNTLWAATYRGYPSGRTLGGTGLTISSNKGHMQMSVSSGGGYGFLAGATIYADNVDFTTEKRSIKFVLTSELIAQTLSVYVTPTVLATGDVANGTGPSSDNNWIRVDFSQATPSVAYWGKKINGTDSYGTGQNLTSGAHTYTIELGPGNNDVRFLEDGVELDAITDAGLTFTEGHLVFVFIMLANGLTYDIDIDSVEVF